jgi:deoxyribodipyrimidine photolyase
MTAEEQKTSGCRVGIDYPCPVVDHAREKSIALELFGAIRK